MYYKRADPPKEVEKELEDLYNAWYSLPEDECGELNDFLRKNGSKAMQQYLRECDEIRAYYGEDVRV